ncbi:MAG: DUF92 domain-containing protein [Gemmatimonadota bacterium]|nr:DUF92 domain-containing protein [Gemmatimonadota bacterium]
MLAELLKDRETLGAIVSVVVAFAAWKARALTRGGAVAGFVAGTISIAAGWSWGFLLLGFFITASVLSRMGGARKTELLGPIVAKGGDRDAWQVAANGAVYVGAAAASFVLQNSAAFAVAIGALAASMADTWSTEIGTFGGGVPRLIVSGRNVPAGTSGGITLSGTIGALGGALFAALGARWAGWPVPFHAVFAAGIAGAFADSLLGATIQSKRWCERCASATERTIHVCGSATVNAAGLGWLNNDGVNFVSTVVGGLVALLLSGIGSAG